MKRLAPGVYDDGRGGMHLDVEELLAANGFADTPANRRAIADAARESFPGGKATVIHDPDDVTVRAACAMYRAGAPHDCADWIRWKTGTCAVCGRRVQ